MRLEKITKKSIITTISIIVVTLSLNCLIIFLVKQPAFIPIFDFNSESSNNISTTYSNFISPILNLITIVFVYLTFKKQNEAIRQDRENNINLLILNHFDNLNKVINSFYSTGKNGKGEEYIKTGIIAIKDICTAFSYMKSLPKKFGDYLPIRMLINIISSFNYIEQVIESLQVSDFYKEFYLKKLSDIYYSQLSIPFGWLKKSITSNKNSQDDCSNLLLEFIKKYNPHDQELIDLN